MSAQGDVFPSFAYHPEMHKFMQISFSQFSIIHFGVEEENMQNANYANFSF